MPKLPLREIEEARSNPVVYRAKMLGGDGGQPRSYGYFNALRDGIFEFHDYRLTKAKGLKALKARLKKKFKNSSKIDETLGRFEWYADEYAKRGWSTAKTRLNITISLPAQFGSSITCSGQVSRVDLADSGFYAAWLLRSGTSDDWETETQMPLIQEAVASGLAVSNDEVKVGIYSFIDREVKIRAFTEKDIQGARTILTRLLKSLV